MLRDRGGNTTLIVAASIAPLLAIVGGGIDMGRSYLTESRLQQACDSAVLAARKKLGTTVVTDGLVPAAVATSGNRFFNLNFNSGTFGTKNRAFAMTLEPDYSISGVATVEVPTTIMKLFAFNKVDVRVECEARINFTNTDVMMVLDTTGSMNTVNPGDKVSRIDVLKSVVQNFHAQLEGSKGAGIRIRYGFVPYAVNVNVGALLQNDWVVNNWTYQSVETLQVSSGTQNYIYTENWTYISGGYSEAIQSTYAATYNSGSNKSDGEIGGGSGPYYSCGKPLPKNTYKSSKTLLSTLSEAYAGPPTGTKITKRYRLKENGKYYWVSLNGTTCEVRAGTYAALTRDYSNITVPAYNYVTKYRYAPIARDVTNWRAETQGCMEERKTYEITDYNNVDLNQALDLDIDRVPTAGQPETQWRPAYPDIIRGRSLDWEGDGAFSVPEVTTTDAWLFKPATYPGLATCSAPARKLAEMNASDVSSYLSTLVAEGATYHDIGMIWGGRLLSPTGLFAADNANVAGKPTNRHLIFLTDGQTAPLDIAYGAYGIEPLDQRRCTNAKCTSAALTVAVEKRFTVACNEVKKRNVTVWVIGFGTSMSQAMMDCAGTGRWFQADDASQLNSAFTKIAGSMGDLRISK